MSDSLRNKTLDLEGVIVAKGKGLYFQDEEGELYRISSYVTQGLKGGEKCKAQVFKSIHSVDCVGEVHPGTIKVDKESSKKS